MKKAKVSPRSWDVIFIPFIQRRYAKPVAGASDIRRDIRRDIDVFKVQHQEDMRRLKSNLETSRKNKDAAREATKALERDYHQIWEDVRRCTQDQREFEEQLRTNRLARREAMAEID